MHMRKHGKYIIFSVPIEKELENDKKIIYRKKLINSLDLWRADNLAERLE